MRELLYLAHFYSPSQNRLLSLNLAGHPHLRRSDHRRLLRSTSSAPIRPHSRRPRPSFSATSPQLRHSILASGREATVRRCSGTVTPPESSPRRNPRSPAGRARPCPAPPPLSSASGVPDLALPLRPWAPFAAGSSRPEVVAGTGTSTTTGASRGSRRRSADGCRCHPRDSLVARRSVHPTCFFQTVGGAYALTGQYPGTSTRPARAALASVPGAAARCSH